MSTFELEILTPDRAAPPRPVESLSVPAEGGRLTVLSRHQPLVCLVRAGAVHITAADGQREHWTVGPGTLRVARDRVTLLTERAQKMG
jgi:F0F1-type ATP synthase epsilon subunit